MIPNSFSATALKTASGCKSRYKAEVIDRGANFQGDAAGVGTVLHGTLEYFVRAVFVRKDHQWSWEYFLQMFHQEYDKQFGADRKRAEYADALDLATKWFYDPNNEEDLSTNKVLSLEAKNNFPIKTTAGEIPCNYIMDRVEQLPTGEYKVVDYKTNRFALTAAQLQNNIQARLYALALQIIYKDAKRIWVEFQYLRHSPVAVAFTKADNAETWRELKRMAQDIIDTSDEDAEKDETLNSECGFCVKKGTCKTLARNVKVGGIHAMADDELAERFLKIGYQEKALRQLKSELEAKLMAVLLESELTQLETSGGIIRLTAPSRRVLDHAKAPLILGQELTNELVPLTMGKVDALLKGNRITEVQKELLRNLITSESGEAKIVVVGK